VSARLRSYCLTESGVLAGEPGNWMGDKGYVGNDMLTPIKKPANFKTWRIMHTDYRRPLDTFTQTISTVIALHFYKLGSE